MFRMIYSVAAIALALFGIAGCGPQEKPKALLRGNVSLNGAPVKGGSIKFTPLAGDGPTAGAAINAEGDYSTELLAGTMRVEITSPKVTGKRKAYDTPDSPLIELTEEQIPEKYNTKSELTYEVSAGEREVEKDFDLTGDVKK